MKKKKKTGINEWINKCGRKTEKFARYVADSGINEGGGLINFQRGCRRQRCRHRHRRRRCFSSLRFHSKPLIRRFPRLLARVDAQFSGLQRSTQRIFFAWQFLVSYIHLCIGYRETDGGKREPLMSTDQRKSGEYDIWVSKRLPIWKFTEHLPRGEMTISWPFPAWYILKIVQLTIMFFHHRGLCFSCILFIYW